MMQTQAFTMVSHWRCQDLPRFFCFTVMVVPGLSSFDAHEVAIHTGIWRSWPSSSMVAWPTRTARMFHTGAPTSKQIYNLWYYIILLHYCIYIYICIYVDIVFIIIYLYLYIYISKYICNIYVYIHINLNIYIYIYMYIYMNMYIYIYIYAST